jgi:hypothetical protein
MRIKYTSLHSVIKANPADPWAAGPDDPERLKRESLFDREAGKRQIKVEPKRKGERALGWLRRSH